MVNLGYLEAGLGDADGATRAWQRVIDSNRADDDNKRCRHQLGRRRRTYRSDCRGHELLQLAAQNGWPVASTYAAALLDRDSPDRTETLHALRHRPDDTDALNFLGIVARADGDLEKARAFWDTSVVGGDDELGRCDSVCRDGAHSAGDRTPQLVQTTVDHRSAHGNTDSTLPITHPAQSRLTEALSVPLETPHSRRRRAASDRAPRWWPAPRTQVITSVPGTGRLSFPI